MNTTPCANLIAVPNGPTKCYLDRRFPEDCPGCASYEAGLTLEERTRCEVWTRVMGYHRPVAAFNPGKQAEHRDRKAFVESPEQQSVVHRTCYTCASWPDAGHGDYHRQEHCMSGWGHMPGTATCREWSAHE